MEAVLQEPFEENRYVLKLLDKTADVYDNVKQANVQKYNGSSIFVSLRTNDKKFKQIQLSHLVLKYFGQNYKDNKHVLYINGDRTDLSLENLMQKEKVSIYKGKVCQGQ